MKIAKFISLVKERPILYDSLNPLYKDRKAKEKMWREISTTMNIHSDIAKNRWKSLKDCFTKYLKSTMDTGPAVYLKYINWQWAEHMEFMKPHIKFGLIMSNIELKDNQETDDLSTRTNLNIQEKLEELEAPEHVEIAEDERHKKSNTNETIEIHKNVRIPKRLKPPSRSSKHEKTIENIKRRRRSGIPSTDANNSLGTDTFVQYFEKKKPDKYSATELIFLGYAKTIKTFSIRRQAQVKMKIAKIMMEEEIAHFEDTVSHSEY